MDFVTENYPDIHLAARNYVELNDAYSDLKEKKSKLCEEFTKIDVRVICGLSYLYFRLERSFGQSRSKGDDDEGNKQEET